MASAYSPSYPVHVEARLDPQLSRALWLVKWLLVLPHYVILAFLWIAFVILSIVAFFAILLTGNYPRAIFDFNVGVLRWSWRVSYYAYSALGTDRYPPFSLEDDPDYPARLDVEYPQHLSRGLVLVKWWLLAIPHYVIVAIFVSGGIYLARAGGNDLAPLIDGAPGPWGSGLIGLLVAIAAIILLFTGHYPRQLFDLILGLNRWVIRVAAYAGLMTDQYPPFRLDQGGDDPDGTFHPSPPPTSSAGVTPDHPTAAPGREVSPGTPVPRGAAAAPGDTGRPAATSRWSVGRVVSTVMASIALLSSLGLLGAGAASAIADSALRDSSGYLMSGARVLSTGTYALVSPTIELSGSGVAGGMPHRMMGDAKVAVTADSGKPIFVGLADAGAADAYLAEVRHATVRGGGSTPTYAIHPGQAPAEPPGESPIWLAQATGTGTQSLVAPVTSGRWTVVVMNADGTAGIDTTMRVGVTAPGLGSLATVLLSVGTVVLVLSLVVMVLAVRGATARPHTTGSGGDSGIPLPKVRTP